MGLEHIEGEYRMNKRGSPSWNEAREDAERAEYRGANLDELTEEQLREARHQQRLAARPILHYSRRRMIVHLKIDNFDQEELRDLILGLWGALVFADQKDLKNEMEFYLTRPAGLPAISRAIVEGMKGGQRLS